MLRGIAPDSGLVSNGKLEKSDINPLRPHALRASFSDQMSKAGASKMLIDYLMGHKLQYDTVYFGGEEGLRKSYVRYAKEALEPSDVESAGALVKKVTAEVEERNRALQALVNELTSQNQKLENRVVAIEAQNQKITASLAFIKANWKPGKFLDIEPVTEKQ